jgi:hypothetical protein
MVSSLVLRRKAERSLRTAANLTDEKVAASLRALAAEQLKQADAQDRAQSDEDAPAAIPVTEATVAGRQRTGDDDS